MIVQQAEVKKVDFLIIGRRGMSTLKRIFVGSTSKYCLEHANCSVLVVKGEWGPSEEHVGTFNFFHSPNSLKALSEIDKLEEEERKRRIAEHEKALKEHGIDTKEHGIGMPVHLQEIIKEVESKSKEDKTEHLPHEEIHQEFK